MRRRLQQVVAQPGPLGHARRDQLHQAQANRFDHHPEPPDQEPAQNRAQIVARSTHDHHHPDEKGKAQRLVRAGRQLSVERRHHRACDPADGRAEHEDLQMPRGDVLAHRLGRDLVVADRAHHPAPGRVQRPLDKDEEADQHDCEQPRIDQLDPDRRGPDRVHPPTGHPVDKARIVLQINLVRGRAGQAHHIFHAARQPVFVLHHGDDDLGNAERCDGQIIRT
mmetsp:Transcript_23572/g.41693  ORF Transcript_23572/g.41693 Transcript_23572/m.41693 type:complete len:223 (+) Transcript_23572:3070-3738(+)